ncbi:MAG: hypothetical protein ACJAU6_003553 [Alphaproteobacteria bacterium]|jgi:hypothetical protein
MTCDIVLEHLPPNITRSAASNYLKSQHGICRTPKTLAKLACVGGGPKFRKDGRLVLYPVSLLDDWVEEQLTAPMASTAEYEAAK